MPEVTEVDRGDLWSQLLPEIIHHIYQNLPDLGDYVRFRAVCTTWRNVAPASNPPPQLPWILECSHTSSSECLVRPQLCFYSHSVGRTYNLRMVGRHSWILGSGTSQGYIVGVVNLSWTMLYNPITGEGEALPLAPFMPFNDGVFSVLDDNKAGCVVVNTCTKKRYFAFCRPRVDADWRIFDRCKNMGSNTYNNGMFYVNTPSRETLAISSTSGSIEDVVARPFGEKLCNACGDYLVGSRGKLLRVIKHSHSRLQDVLSTNFYFSVYQPGIPQADGTVLWTKVDSIGDTVLFIDDHGQGFSLEPNDAAGVKRGCIYFLFEKKTWLWPVRKDRILCGYNMKDGRVDMTMPMGDRFADTWVIPSLCHLDE